MIDEAKRQKYRELKAEADEVYAAAASQRAALDVAMMRHAEIDDEIEILIGEHDVESCEACSKAIFEGDKRTTSIDAGPFCEECSPMLSDMIKQYRKYLNANLNWEEYGFATRDEMEENLSDLESDVAKNGDRSAAS